VEVGTSANASRGAVARHRLIEVAIQLADQLAAVLMAEVLRDVLGRRGCATAASWHRFVAQTPENRPDRSAGR